MEESKVDSISMQLPKVILSLSLSLQGILIAVKHTNIAQFWTVSVEKRVGDRQAESRFVAAVNGVESPQRLPTFPFPFTQRRQKDTDHSVIVESCYHSAQC